MDTRAIDPTISENAGELQAHFGSKAALDEAVGRLGQAGFNRADFSVPSLGGELNAAPPKTETDQRQGRTLVTSMAAAAGALAAAGVVAATGGAAIPAVAAAVAGGVAAGGAGGLATTASKMSEDQEMSTEAAAGNLVLTVRLRDAHARAKAEQILHDAGAVNITERPLG
jgi:hypothetical protein